jgi:phosphoribosylformylglycinamidine cyclo-ligase
VSSTYRDAGVDQEAADALIGAYAAEAARTRGNQRPIAIGGFAGLFSIEDLAERGYANPVLAFSTDTTGTKIDLLRRAGLHRTAGWDCVAMNVDDVVCVGAEPLAFVDCIAIERLDPAEAKEIVAGVADGCVAAGCELVGGETAQLPGLLAPSAYEVMGTCVGVVDRDRAWGPHRVRDGDDIVALASSGPHSNGYSLVRRVLASTDAEPPSGLLAPTAIYARKLLSLAESVEVRAAAHITGGGIADNVARAMPDGLVGRVDRDTWDVPPVFAWLQEHGDLTDEVMVSTFNLGIGMIVITPDGNRAVDALTELGLSSWVCGEARR